MTRCIQVLGAAWLGTLLLSFGFELAVVWLTTTVSAEDIQVLAVLATLPAMLTAMIGGTVQLVRRHPSPWAIAVIAVVLSCLSAGFARFLTTIAAAY